MSSTQQTTPHSLGEKILGELPSLDFRHMVALKHSTTIEFYSKVNNSNPFKLFRLARNLFRSDWSEACFGLRLFKYGVKPSNQLDKSGKREVLIGTPKLQPDFFDFF
jgi:hypothetical protein